MIRIMSSSISVGASITDQVITSTISNLTDVIPSSAIAHPYGIKFTGTLPSDLTVTKVILKSDLSEENVYSIYNGAAIPLSDLSEYLKPNADGIGITVVGFKPDHGLKLELTCSNGTTAYTENVVWAIENGPNDGNQPFRAETPNIRSGAGHLAGSNPLLAATTTTNLMQNNPAFAHPALDGMISSRDALLSSGQF